MGSATCADVVAGLEDVWECTVDIAPGEPVKIVTRVTECLAPSETVTEVHRVGKPADITLCRARARARVSYNRSQTFQLATFGLVQQRLRSAKVPTDVVLIFVSFKLL